MLTLTLSENNLTVAFYFSTKSQLVLKILKGTIKALYLKTNEGKALL